MRSFTVLSFLVFANQCLGANWDGCYDIAKSDPDAKLKKNKPTQVCFATGPAGDWGMGVDYRRYAFQPSADNYSKFSVPGSYKSLVQNEDVTVFASSQKALSFMRKYYDKSYGVFPHLTAIIDVKDGVVKGIAWDDACIFCADNLCKENTYNFNGSPAVLDEPTKGCYLTKDQCDEIHRNDGTDCDLNIHVVWTGTDEKGKYLTSSNNRFSAFQPKQIQDFFKDSVTQWIPNFGGLF